MLTGDLTKDEFCSELISVTISKFSQIDILINCAGIYLGGPFETWSVKEYDSIIDINVRSVIVLTQKCVPYLKVTRGSVVNVSSSAGLRAVKNLSYYCISKAAVDMFTKCMALELAPSGIRVNSVNPGIVRVKPPAGIDEKVYDEIMEMSKNIHPIGKHGEVEDVANLITFLVSKEASFIVGSLVSIDGGWMHNIKQL